MGAEHAADKLENLFTVKSSDGGQNFRTHQISISANQILDAANLDTFSNQDNLFIALKGSLVKHEFNSTNGSELTFNKLIFLFMRGL